MILNAFHTACGNNDLEKIKEIISQYRNYVASLCSFEVKIDNTYSTALGIACRKGHHSIVKYIVESGAHTSINAADSNGARPLHHASLTGKLDLVQYLITHGAMPSINVAESDDFTPLHNACQFGTLDVVRHFVTNGATSSINAASSDNLTPLHFACFVW